MTKTPSHNFQTVYQYFRMAMYGRWPLLVILGAVLIGWNCNRKEQHRQEQLRIEQERRISANETEYFERLLQQAEQGGPDAQVNMGDAYAFEGIGGEKDIAEAIKWYRKAADQGHRRAQMRLLEMAFEGTNGILDDEEVMRKAHDAAESGDLEAQIALGNAYFMGMVRKANEAAENGDLEAEIALGYVDDDSGKVNERFRMVEAKKWFRIAVEQGDAFSMRRLGDCYRWDGDYEQAAMWRRNAAESGDAGAQYSLGIQHLSGDGVEKDTIEAARWILKAAEQGNPEALEHLERLSTEPDKGKDYE